ncbi:hypothetical protein KHQ81_12635 [Mycoplasmatota bacterium]|nr:hypothetical protein KHQ81_12635 [Mycoplasmatota bacterium]
MDDNVLFEYYPYKTDKTIKVGYWVFIFVFIGLIITGILMIIEGLIKKDNVEIISSIMPFVFAISMFFLLLSFKNRELQIFSDHISIYSIFRKEKIYKLNTKLMTIQVNYTTARNRGFKLTFLDSNCSKICSYILLESMTSQIKFKERRKNWGEGLKNIGCSIEDKGHYLLEESINNKHLLDGIEYVNNNQIKDDSCLYIRKLLKRNTILFPVLALMLSIILIGTFSLLYFLGKTELTNVIIFIVMAILQIIASIFLSNIFKKMLRYDDEKLLNQEFSKHALERRKNK